MSKITSAAIIVFFFISFENCFSNSLNDSLLVSTTKDTILLIDGKVIITSVIDTAEGLLNFINPKNAKKISSVELEDVFSIKNLQGEKVIYEPCCKDSVTNDYSVEDMRLYILGEQDGRKTKMVRAPFVANLILSAGAGVTGSFFSPIAPFLFTAIFSRQKVKIVKESMPNSSLLDSEVYLDGYKQEAFKKRNIQTLMGGGIGLMLGIGTSFILKANNIDLIK